MLYAFVYNGGMQKLCSFPNCKNFSIAKDLCNAHWSQQRKGQKLRPIITHETLDERLERSIKKDPISGCWLWIAAGSGKYYKTTGGGYGQLRWHGKSFMAHRYTYMKYHNIILGPDDTLDHICRNTRCVNPEHLQKVSLSENVERKHLYKSLQSENDRFREFIKKLGYCPEKILGDNKDFADILTI